MNVEFVHLVERIVRWWPHVNGVMQQLSAYHKELRSIELVTFEQYMDIMVHGFISFTKCKFILLLTDISEVIASRLHNDRLAL